MAEVSRGSVAGVEFPVKQAFFVAERFGKLPLQPVTRFARRMATRPPSMTSL
jgi:hypothetical protein